MTHSFPTRRSSDLRFGRLSRGQTDHASASPPAAVAPTSSERRVTSGARPDCLPTVSRMPAIPPLIVGAREGGKGFRGSAPSPLQGRGYGGLAACCIAGVGEGLCPAFPSPSFASPCRRQLRYPTPCRRSAERRIGKEGGGKVSYRW